MLAYLAILATGLATANPSPATLVTSLNQAPGYPEGVVVYGNRAFVSGPAAFDNGGAPPSRVWEINLRTGKIVDEHVLTGEFLPAPHGAAGMANDIFGRVYLLSTQLGIVRINPWNHEIESYSTPFPDLPPCTTGITNCSFLPVDLPPLPNDIAFDWEGNAYVTDTLQGLIWKVLPGGGAPELWSNDPRLLGEFGVNGIRLAPDGHTLFVGVTGPPGVIYKVPAGDSPAPEDFEIFAELGAGGPDGLAFSLSGNLYVTLAFANQIVKLSPSGNVTKTYSGPIITPSGSIPFDAPAVLAFEPGRRSIVVVNHALLSSIQENFALFRVEVGEFGFPAVRPFIF